MSFKYDLHIHSNRSDGTYTPSDVVRMAKQNGLNCIALTDHDTIDGLSEAAKAGEKLSVSVINGVELDIESPFELHILGLGIQSGNEALSTALENLRSRRKERNAIILNKLSSAGIDIKGYLDDIAHVETRMHIALALLQAGYANNLEEAFQKFLQKGSVGYYHVNRFEAKEAISLIKGAKGIAVLAHPCHIHANIHKTVAQLKQAGLEGIEAYYPSCSQGQIDLFVSLARQHGLLVTAGSDFHGENRPGIKIGMMWRDGVELQKTGRYIRERFC